LKPVFVRDLPAHVNQTITTFFLVVARETRAKKTGEPYISLLLGDSSGEVEARVWENVDSMPAFERDDFVKVKGLVQVFRNKPQISVHRLRKAEESEIEIGDFFRRSARDAEEMFVELGGIVAEVANPYTRRLLESILEDEEIAAALRRAPAAKTLHHAYLGGLLEHILSLCALARLVAGQYPSLDLDLLIAAALLHDLGKIHELEYSRGISYSTEGHLLGHIVIGLRIVERKAAAIEGFPDGLRVLLEHFVISHHGEYEFGSPKTPMLPEALVFHYLDDLDSKMNHMSWHLESDGSLEGEWTTRSAALGRPLLKLREYLKARPAAAGGQTEGLEAGQTPAPAEGAAAAPAGLRPVSPGPEEEAALEENGAERDEGAP
jgi:3'-5' exoribonuclease